VEVWWIREDRLRKISNESPISAAIWISRRLKGVPRPSIPHKKRRKAKVKSVELPVNAGSKD